MVQVIGKSLRTITKPSGIFEKIFMATAKRIQDIRFARKNIYQKSTRIAQEIGEAAIDALRAQEGAYPFNAQFLFGEDKKGRAKMLVGKMQARFPKKRL